MQKTLFRIALPLGLVIMTVIARLVPHAPNLAPVAALALLGGASYKFPKSLLLPLGAMAISDLFIGFSPWPITLSVYGSFIIISLLGMFLRQPKLWKLPVSALASSLLFYVITNFTVWLTSGMYQKTFQGLIYCYINALPFLKNTIVGDLIYTVVIFLTFFYATKLFKTFSVSSRPSLACPSKPWRSALPLT
jgi:hypothetical protein